MFQLDHNMTKILTPETIRSMDYSNFVSLIDERNRCSGGIKTIQETAINSGLNEKSRVLEIGSNTGFNSVNLAYLTGCSTIGIDTNLESVLLARQYAERSNLQNRVNFKLGDATNLGYPPESFDFVLGSNALSFIGDKNRAMSECLRVLKTRGTFCLVPIYYRKAPPKKLVREISKAIGTEIDIRSKSEWRRLIENSAEGLEFNLQLYYESDYCYEDVSGKIKGYIERQMKKEHLRSLKSPEKDAIQKKAEDFYFLFNENLKYCGFSVLLFQKRLEKEEEELFLSKKI